MIVSVDDCVGLTPKFMLPHFSFGPYAPERTCHSSNQSKTFAISVKEILTRCRPQILSDVRTLAAHLRPLKSSLKNTSLGLFAELIIGTGY